MFLTIFFSTAAFLLYVIYKYFQEKSEFYKLSKKIPGPIALPLVGNSLQIFFYPKGLLKYLINCQKKYGPVTKHWMGNKLYIFLSDPNDIKICLTDPNNLTYSPMYECLELFLGNVILNTKGGYWESHKKIIKNYFDNNNLKEQLKIIDKKVLKFTNTLIEQGSKGTAIDIYPDVRNLLTEIIFAFALGVENITESVSDNTVAGYIPMVCDFFNTKDFYPFLSQKKIIDLASKFKKIEDLIDMVFFSKLYYRERGFLKQHLKKSPCFEKSFLNFLILNIGKNLNDSEVMDELTAVSLAGFNTTITSICYSLYYLAENPLVQEKAFNEIKQCFHKNEEITMENIVKAHYLDQIVKEVLRLKPPIPFYSRILEKDMQLTNYRLPAGTIVNIFPLMLHHDPKIYPNPDEFNPERHSLVGNKNNLNQYYYIPFGAGPRKCIGEKYAMLIIKTALVRILEKYNLFPGKKIEDEKVFFALSSPNGYHLQICKRS